MSDLERNEQGVLHESTVGGASEALQKTSQEPLQTLSQEQSQGTLEELSQEKCPKEQPKVSIEIDTIGVLNYPLVQAKWPVVEKVFLVNDDAKDIELKGISIRFEMQFDFMSIKPVEDISLPIAYDMGAAIPVDVAVDAKSLFTLNEPMEDTITAIVTDADGRELARKSAEIHILPMNYWIGQFLPQTLAAFVMPNVPKIKELQRRAAQLLKELTGDSSFSGYQREDKNFVRAQMAAIYAAIYEQNIAYVKSPPSFTTAQRIRTVEEVLSTKMGNCIEMSILFCSLAEACGLNPFIVLVPSHAYAGAWLQDELFSESYVRDFSELDKRLAKGIHDVEVVECTAMNEGSGIRFEQAVRRAHETTEEGIEGLVDVRYTHYTSIRPMPIISTEQGETKVVDYGLADDALDQGQATKTVDEYVLDLTARQTVDKKTIWMRNLLDISKRNSLISFKPTPKTIQLFGRSLGALEDALADGKSLAIKDVVSDWRGSTNSASVINVDSESEFVERISEADYKAGQVHTFLEGPVLAKRIKDIYREGKKNLEESGANSLYLALGLLRWIDPKDTADADGNMPVRYAPLVLVPIELVRGSRDQYSMRVREDDPQFNITLVEMLRTQFNLRLDGLNPLPTDEHGIDLPLVFSTVRRAVMNMPLWDVDEVAFIANFSFSSFVMWNDLRSCFDKLTENKVVKALVEGRYTDHTTEDIAAERLDDDYKVSDIAIPSSIDSSQLAAVIEASEGASFVLHGPPGTGKSQTITNLIANSLYQGKTVLFVAEKMAALNVVADRLGRIGLGDFCGEIHSNKTQKRVVLDKLQSVLELKHKADTESYVRKTNRIQTIKDELNRQLLAIHKTRPQGFSLYDMIDICSTYPTSYRTITFDKEVLESLDRTAWDQWLFLVEQLQSVLSSLSYSVKNHPLRAFTKENYSLSNKDILSELLASLRHELTQLQHVRTELPQDIPIDMLQHIIDFGDIIKERNIQTKIDRQLWLTLLNPDVTLQCESLRAAAHALEDNKLSIGADYTEQIEQLDLVSIATAVTEARTGLLSFFTKSKNVAKALVPLNAIRKSGEPISDDTWDDELQRLQQLQESYRAVEQMANHILERCGNAVDIGFDKVDAILDLYAISQYAVCKVNESPQIDEEYLWRTYDLAQSVSWHGTQPFTAVHDALALVVERAKEVETVCGASLEVLAITDEAIGTAIQQCTDWQQHLDLWKQWAVVVHAQQALLDAGLGAVVSYVAQAESTSNLRDIFEASVSYQLIKIFTNQSPELAQFSRIVVEGKISEYVELIQDLATLSQEQIKSKLLRSIPDNRTCTDVEAKQLAQINRVIQSKGRGVSIRDLFNQNGQVMRRLLPCMLMSPLSVAQYIDLDFPKFDLVIFDEASQIRTGTAVGAMSRARDVIIVGDPKQMPPTNFFNSTKLDEDHLQFEDLESLLEDCLAVNMPQRYLSCHYRSQSESLIAFSNEQYYDGKMMTFPAPTDLVSKVTFTKIDGTYDRGNTRTNAAEADAIVKAITDRLQRGETDTSIGVITFNMTQANLIEDRLQAILDRDSVLREAANAMYEPIFVKNLENVQGDERDCIYFSITYGPNEEGKVYQNFGPLGQNGGWRRLNVAVSRARKEMHLISTLDPRDIVVTTKTAEGVRGLRDFMLFARHGHMPHDTTAAEPNDFLIMSIRDVLTEAGYDVRTYIGTSQFKIPLAVITPGTNDTYGCAILVDDESYANLPTMRDRNALIPSVLTRMGWPIYRIWTMDWFEQQDIERQRLLDYLEEIVGKPKPLATATASSDSTEVDADESTNDTETIMSNDSTTMDTIASANNSTIIYSSAATAKEMYNAAHSLLNESVNTNIEHLMTTHMEALPEELADSIELSASTMTTSKPYTAYMVDELRPTTDLTESRYAIIDLAQAIVDAEAPIHEDYLMKRISEVYSGARLTTNSRDFIKSCLKRITSNKQTQAKEIYYWGSLDHQAYYLFRTPTDTVRRDMMYINNGEIGNAVLYVLSQHLDDTESVAMDEETLCREVAKQFGFGRMTDNIKSQCKAGVSWCVRKKLVERDGKDIKLCQPTHD